MAYFRLLFSLFFILLSTVCFGADPSNKLVSIEFPVSTKNNMVTLQFTGKIYDEKYTFEYISKRIKESKATDVEKFIFRLTEVSKSGDKDEILKFWKKKEQAEIAKSLNDSELLRNNTAFYKNVLSSKLVSVVHYGDYVLCYVLHDVRGIDSFVKLYPMFSEKTGSLSLTNELSGDFFYMHFSRPLGEYIQENYQ